MIYESGFCILHQTNQTEANTEAIDQAIIASPYGFDNVYPLCNIRNCKRAQLVVKISINNPNKAQELFTSSLKGAQLVAMILITVLIIAQLPILMILGSEELILYDSSLNILLCSYLYRMPHYFRNKDSYPSGCPIF